MWIIFIFPSWLSCDSSNFTIKSQLKPSNLEMACKISLLNLLVTSMILRSSKLLILDMLKSSIATCNKSSFTHIHANIFNGNEFNVLKVVMRDLFQPSRKPQNCITRIAYIRRKNYLLSSNSIYSFSVLFLDLVFLWSKYIHFLRIWLMPRHYWPWQKLINRVSKISECLRKQVLYLH